MTGRTLGHYQILDSLGAGAMGEVYLAEDTTLKRKVALKVLPPELAESPERLERFQREAEALATLNHPNIIHVYSVESDDGVHFITMELVEGQTLDALIPSDGMVLEQFLALAVPIADALAEAHERGIIHRDLKPTNIMVDDKGRPKIVDFGLAKLSQPEAGEFASDLPTQMMTQEGRVLGTYPYMSPEQAEGRAVDHRSDLFSFGSVLYEMATGVRPFQGNSPASLLGAILKDEPKPPGDLRDDLPEILSQILDRCLEKAADDRYSTAAELGSDLVALRQATESGISLELSGRAKRPPFLLEEIEEVPQPVFVGREAELASLDAALSKVLSGQGQVVFVTGEAGTGKTALAQAFVHRAQAEHSQLVTATGGCSAHTGAGDPYSPVRQVLSQLTGDVETNWRAGTVTSDQATRLWGLLPTAASSIVESGTDLVGTLLVPQGLLKRAELAAGRGALWLSPLKELIERKITLPPDVMLQQRAIFGQCTRLLQDLASESPLLLVLEDLHWSDTGSVDLLSHLARQLAGQRILVIGTFRPSEISAGRGDDRHPLEGVIHEMERSFGDCQIHVRQEGDTAFVDELVDSEPNQLGRLFRDRLYERTQGHALFTVELLRAMQERGMLVQDDDGAWVQGSDLDWEALPAQVGGVISERIGRLSQDLRELLTVASVEGESFTAEVLARIQKTETRETVRLLGQELERGHRLVTAEGLKRVNANRLSLYRFLHVLFQKYLYDELDEAERAYLHEDVGTVLEELFGEESNEIAGQLARHFEMAGILDKAIRYRVTAGQTAVGLSAHREALRHYRRALDLITTLRPSLERNETELDLQVAISSSLMMAEGWSAPGIRDASSRALELSEKLRGNPRVVPALFQLCWYSCNTGHMFQGVQFGHRMLEAATELQDRVQVAVAHFSLGLSQAMSGESEVGRAHIEKVETFWDSEQHSWLANVYGLDHGMAAKVHLGWMLANSGYLDQSRVKCEEAIALATRIRHPHSLCFSLRFAGISDMRRHDWIALETHASRALELAKEHGFLHLAGYAFPDKGLALAALGQAQDGIELIQRGLATLEAIHQTNGVPHLLELLARALAFSGQWDEAHMALDRMAEMSEELGEFMHLPHVQVIRGKFYAENRKFEAAEECLIEGIEAARSGQERLFELEGATSMARVWSSQGKRTEALRLLEPVYDWFTEGFDELPVKEAKAVLDELRSD